MLELQMLSTIKCMLNFSFVTQMPETMRYSLGFH